MHRPNVAPRGGRRGSRGSIEAGIGVAVAAVLAVGVVGGAAAGGSATAPSGTTTTAPTRQSEPVPVASVPIPTLAPDLSWPWGECTWFVAQYRRVTWWGNAADWLDNARAQGRPTTTIPTVGSIVVYRRGKPYDSANGHVALVVAATLDSYSVTEMNYIGLGRVDVRTIAWPDPDVQGFIQ
jgi:surface antigen